MDHSHAIAQLQRVFGNNVDKDSLIAVLEVCGGNVDEARKYLEATDPGSGYDANQLAAETSLPSDYPGNTNNRGNRWGSPAPTITPIDSKTEAKESMEDKMKGLFTKENVSLQEHFDSQQKNYELYVSVLLLLINQGVEITKSSRARILAACWARKDNALADYLLLKDDLFGLPQVLGAVTLLDAPRKIRSIEKKVGRLEKQGTTKAKKLGGLKSTINDLNREAHIGSVSGALAKRIRRWLRSIPKAQLEFYALNLPKQPWMDLVDIVHAKPTDFQCGWFLEFLFGKGAPTDSVIVASQNLTTENITSILKTTPMPYSYLRLHVKPIPEDAKVIIATYSPIDTVIWWYEELCNKEVDEVIDKRLDSELPKFGYGKLMERLLYFKINDAKFYKKLIPLAEKRLQQIDLQLESPVAILGDASYSMDVAIRVSTVISSLITSLTGAELKFFSTEAFDPPKTPKTVEDVIDIAVKVKSHGGTAPASALYEYYRAKKVVKFFILVTDEVENDKYNNYYFPTLFQKYYKEVFPAKIVFASFLENPSGKGRMVNALEQMGINVLQFKLDGRRPDLTKLDSLLGLLASESTFFPKQVEGLMGTIKEGGVIAGTKKFEGKGNEDSSVEGKMETLKLQ